MRRGTEAATGRSDATRRGFTARDGEGGAGPPPARGVKSGSSIAPPASRAAQRPRGTTALVPRRGRRKAAPGLRHGPQGAASSGPARRPSPGTRLAASTVVHLAAFLIVVAFGAVAAREPVARLVQAAAKPPRQLMACHGACCQGAPPRARTPRATPDHDGDDDEKETDEGSG